MNEFDWMFCILSLSFHLSPKRFESFFIFGFTLGREVMKHLVAEAKEVGERANAQLLNAML